MFQGICNPIHVINACFEIESLLSSEKWVAVVFMGERGRATIVFAGRLCVLNYVSERFREGHILVLTVSPLGFRGGGPVVHTGRPPGSSWYGTANAAWRPSQRPSAEECHGQVLQRSRGAHLHTGHACASKDVCQALTVTPLCCRPLISVKCSSVGYAHYNCL